MSVFLPNEVDFSKLSYGPLSTTPGAPAMCKLLYGGSSNRFRLQTPKCNVPFGITEPLDQYKVEGKDKYTLELSLDTNIPRIKTFKEFLEKFDEHNIKYISDNSKTLLGEQTTVAEVKKYKYFSLIKKGTKSKDQSIEYPDRFRLKLPVSGKEPNKKTGKIPFKKPKFEIVTEVSKGSFEPFVLKKNPESDEIDFSWGFHKMDVECIFEVDGLLYTGGKFYFMTKVIMAKVYANTTQTINFNSFRTIEEDTEKKDAVEVVDEVEEEADVDEEEAEVEDEED